ncbi:PREDICTED: uncharacterized protein LOC106819619, partial [Priapulus caudatus]|uniref:Uncharacterized protein LOC106819619 n=1 Tax=Priapulus caudatus TaxID=37621 RepID=A0ABM1F5J4_PRICU
MPLTHTISKSELKRGDHIYVSRTLHSHHGIWDGREVIHFRGRQCNNEFNARIRRDALHVFLDGAKLKIFRYGMSKRDTWYKINYLSSTQESDPPDTVMARAELRDKDYNLIFNSCQHFALWCKMGERAGN